MNKNVKTRAATPLSEALDTLDGLDANGLAVVAKLAIERIHPDPETNAMHWRTYGELVRRELDRIEFESDARDAIREFAGG